MRMERKTEAHMRRYTVIYNLESLLDNRFRYGDCGKS